MRSCVLVKSYGGREGPFQTRESIISKVDISKLDISNIVISKLNISNTVISKLGFSELDRGTRTHARRYACHVTNIIAPRDPLLAIHDERDGAVAFYSHASYFAKQLRSSLKGFPYPRILSSRISVQTHFVFFVFRSCDIVTETIKADFKETRAKKTTTDHESAKRETTRSSHKGMNQS